ncbi:gamma carbonic anhydrase family protein [Treponema sp.]
MIHAIDAAVPQVHPSSFVAWNAELAGTVKLGMDVSVWFSAVVRADLAPIEVGDGSNIQDGAVLHVDTDAPCRLGKNVTVGHSAILHSCTIGDGSLIGMGAIILNGVEVGEQCIVGAGALLTQGKQFPPRSLILGSPAKVLRSLNEEEIAANVENARHYVELAHRARSSYREVSN